MGSEIQNYYNVAAYIAVYKGAIAVLSLKQIAIVDNLLRLLDLSEANEPRSTVPKSV